VTDARRLAAALLATVVLVTACGAADDGAQAGVAGSSTSDGSGGESGDTLPDVAIRPLDGGDAISLSDIAGPAVINLWATWCAPCRKEIPDFEQVHLARGDEVRFVGINVGEDADRAADFIADVGATYDQFLDPEGYVVTELRTTSMPVTIVLDADGFVSTRHLGPMDENDLDAAIDTALAVTPAG
jgi:thiol-disulfide isomerase/thioredoxin